METRYYILISIKTVDGIESFAQFFIGNDRRRGYTIFELLEGDDEVDEEKILYMEFMETVNGLPVNLRIINCTLGQLASNCRIITKEIFKLKNL
jgi:hypothetical protein